MPLKEHTKTLADLKNVDSTKNLEQADLVLKDKSDRAQIRERLKNNE